MIVIPPVEVTNARLTDSNIPMDDHPEWDDTTVYEVDDLVIVVKGDGTFYHNIYQSVDNGNQNNKPWEDDVDNPQFWNLVGKINRWRMFELIRNTQTIGSDLIEVEITPNVRINSIALFNLQAESVTVTMTDGVDVVYEKTVNLAVRQTLSWSDYFFNPFVFQRSAFFKNLPPITQGVFTIKIEGSGDVRCGGLVIGNRFLIGSTASRAESDTLNFSVVDRNEFGDATLVPRRSIPKSFQRVFTPKSRINRILEIRDDLNARPAVWSAIDDETDGYFDALFILGYYRKFLISADHPKHAIVTLELEEI